MDLSKLPPAADTHGVTFDKDIRPLFEASCLHCHGDGKQKGGLRLDSLAAAIKGGRDGQDGDSRQQRPKEFARRRGRANQRGNCHAAQARSGWSRWQPSAGRSRWRGWAASWRPRRSWRRAERAGRIQPSVSCPDFGDKSGRFARGLTRARSNLVSVESLLGTADRIESKIMNPRIIGSPASSSASRRSFLRLGSVLAPRCSPFPALLPKSFRERPHPWRKSVSSASL